MDCLKWMRELEQSERHNSFIELRHRHGLTFFISAFKIFILHLRENRRDVTFLHTLVEYLQLGDHPCESFPSHRRLTVIRYHAEMPIYFHELFANLLVLEAISNTGIAAHFLEVELRRTHCSWE